jgi:two-component system OmpR family response regulator
MTAVRTLGSPDRLNVKIGLVQKPTSAPSADAAIQILIVEDDMEIARLLGRTIAENGFVPRFATCATEMDDELRHGGRVDLIILDIMLPGENGISICQRLRASSNLPIIMLTALDEDIDRILALELGADDYVTKPFNSRELMARVRTILRRAQSGGNDGGESKIFRFCGWRLSATERQLFNPDGARVTTTSAEFDLLVAFCQNPGRILSRDQLLELTHNGLAGPVERTIDVHISRIRQKIEPNVREPVLIKTVRLGGYLFTPTVEAS